MNLSETAPKTPSLPSLRLLVTAGSTHEPIDAVRYIANRSSGRMGTAIAREAADRGWTCTLLLGPGARRPRPLEGMTVHRYRTTVDLRTLIGDHWPDHDLLVMAAAVADHTPAEVDMAFKIPREGGVASIRLVPTPDLIAEAADARRPGQRLIGFALESGGSITAARRKMDRKGVDAIVANGLETMDATTITGTLLLRDGRTFQPGARLGKRAFAAWLLDHVPLIEPLPR